MIGGLAVQAHGHPRTTRDVDLVVAPDRENMRRLALALRELHARLAGFDAGLLGVDPLDPGDLLRGGNFTLATVAGRVDLWTRPEDLLGAAPWPELRRRSLALAVRGVTIRVIGKDDLIAMKRAAARPRDIEDIAALTDPRSRGREWGGERRPPPPASSERSRDRPGRGRGL